MKIKFLFCYVIFLLSFIILSSTAQYNYATSDTNFTTEATGTFISTNEVNSSKLNDSIDVSLSSSLTAESTTPYFDELTESTSIEYDVSSQTNTENLTTEGTGNLISTNEVNSTKLKDSIDKTNVLSSSSLTTESTTPYFYELKESTTIQKNDYSPETTNHEISTESSDFSSEDTTIGFSSTSTWPATTTTEPERPQTTVNPTEPEVPEGTETPTEPNFDDCYNEKINNVLVTSKPFSLILKWDCSPIQEQCNLEYNVMLKNINFNKNTKECHMEILNLNACENYEGTIKLIYPNSEKPIDEFNFKQNTSEEVEMVRNLTVTEINSNNDIEIQWLAPIKTSKCVNFYIYEFIENNSTKWKSTTENTKIKSYHMDKCANNTFLISAAINDSIISNPAKVNYTNTKLNSPPINKSVETTSEEAYTIWEFGKEIICPEKFLVRCTADEKEYKDTEGIIDIANNILSANISELFAYTYYVCKSLIRNNVGDSEWSENILFQTKPKEPQNPKSLKASQLENGSLFIEWVEPERWNGEELGYVLEINFTKLNYTIIKNCDNINPEPFVTEIDDYNKTNYTFSDIEAASFYTISIKASSSGGFSNIVSTDIVTNEGVPDKPIITCIFEKYSLQKIYNVSLIITWYAPCNIYGNIKDYELNLIDSENKPIHELILPNIDNEYKFKFNDTKPDSNYEVLVRLNLENEFNENVCVESSPAGIPDLIDSEDIPKPNTTDESPQTTVIVYINRNMFDTSMGEILYYAIIVAQNGCEEKSKSGEYDSDNWPEIEKNSKCQKDSQPYQATKQNWNPFNQKPKNNVVDLYNFTLGTEKNCTEKYCNLPLKPNTNYGIKIRGFTKNGFADSKLVYVRTADFIPEINLVLIIGLVVGILVIAIIIAAVLFYTRGKLNFTNWPRMDSNTQSSPAPLPVSIRKFGSHYAKMIENSGKIKNEFQLLSTISSDVTYSTKTAILPINKKKNRYINILPFDQNRIILSETTNTSSDYINASYIQGYSGSNEYIATQGPTEATCPSFWQMILEQNVKLIVMLTQFVESGKEKCYKYFPNLKEEYDLLNDIKVQCLEEILSPVYNRRKFIVKKGNDTPKKVMHIQFNLWPDFGVPSNIKSMIEFCEIMKEIKHKRPGLIVMHCSAGVGRTGTLIAMDILLQTIRDKRKVDIFGTVLNLRKQRMTMVQSEKQYEFLYKCVNYVISNNMGSHTKVQLDQIEENQISESNML